MTSEAPVNVDTGCPPHPERKRLAGRRVASEAYRCVSRYCVTRFWNDSGKCPLCGRQGER